MNRPRPIVLGFLLTHDILWRVFASPSSPSGISFSRSPGTRISLSTVSLSVVLFESLDQTPRSLPMEWTTPQHEEIDLNCEISSYANAEI